MTLTTFKQLYQEYQESSLSVRDFCSNQALSPSTFYYWRKQLGNTAQEAPERFVPLVIDSAPTQKTKHNKHVAIATNKTDGLSISQAPVELVFPNGTKMVIRENIDLRLLKAIVHLFD